MLCLGHPQRKKKQEMEVDFFIPVKQASSYSIPAERNGCFLRSKH
jgi:hypothetical protein